MNNYDAYLDKCLSDYDKESEAALADEVEERGYCAVFGHAINGKTKKCNKCGLTYKEILKQEEE